MACKKCLPKFEKVLLLKLERLVQGEFLAYSPQDYTFGLFQNFSIKRDSFKGIVETLDDLKQLRDGKAYNCTDCK